LKPGEKFNILECNIQCNFGEQSVPSSSLVDTI